MEIMITKNTKIQEIEVLEPIPSLVLHAVKYEKGVWRYCYNLKTPYFLSEIPLEKPLYVYGALQNLTLVASLNKNMVQLPVYTLKDFVDLLDKQRAEDLRFRDSFKKYTSLSDVNTFKVTNANHVFKYPTYIVNIKRMEDTNTEFIGVIKRKQNGKL